MPVTTTSGIGSSEQPLDPGLPVCPHETAILIGASGELHDEIFRGLTDRGVDVLVLEHWAVPARVVGSGVCATTTDPGPTHVETSHSESVIVITTLASPNRRLLAGWRARAAEGADDEQLASAVIDAVSLQSRCRILVLCDARASLRTPAAIRSTKRLALRLGYETTINGTSVQSTSYLVLSAKTPIRTAVAAAVGWCATKAVRLRR